MLKANQLTMAKVAFDFMQSVASRKAAMQIARLNGEDETVIVSSTGSIVIKWPGKVSKKVPTDTRYEAVPVDWDEAEEVNGLLVSRSPANCHEVYPEDRAATVAESLNYPITEEGMVGLDVIACRSSFKYIVTQGNAINLVRTSIKGYNEYSWVSSIRKLEKLVMSVSEDHLKFLNRILSLDDEAKVTMTLHSSNASILNIVSMKTKVGINLCMPVPPQGSEIYLTKTIKTTPTNRGTFDNLIDTLKKGKEEMSEVNTNDQLSALAAMAKGAGIIKPTVTEEPVATEKPEEKETVEVKQAIVSSTEKEGQADSADTPAPQTTVVEDINVILELINERKKSDKELEVKLKALAKKITAEEKARKTGKKDKSREELRKEIFKELQTFLDGTDK